MATLTTDTPALEASAGRRGLWAWITTTDHKRIGILYGISAMVFFVVGGVEALLMIPSSSETEVERECSK